MAITNGRNLAELASLINSDGKISAEAFSAELAASIDPTMYDSASDVPFEDAVKGTQVFVPSEGLLIKLTDSDWYSIDGSTGAAAAAWVFQGSVSGYTSGGLIPSFSNVIDKFPFAADANATDVGDLTVARQNVTGQSSDVSGYTSGGNQTTIDKFPFATDGNAADVGDIGQSVGRAAGQSSAENGYVTYTWETAGAYPAPPTFASHIEKFPFAADANATDIGDLSVERTYTQGGNSSSVNGYTPGGNKPSPTSPDLTLNTIDKFPFASDGNATDVGDLTVGRANTTGQSSTESGYVSGGGNNTIDKFPFATDANATDVGDLTAGKYGAAGQSSTQSGYSSGGRVPASVDTIEKFPFAADANATDVGNLTQSRGHVAGQQV